MPLEAIQSNKHGNVPPITDLQAKPFIVLSRWNVEDEPRFATKQEAKQYIESEGLDRRMYIVKIISRTSPIKPTVILEEETI